MAFASMTIIFLLICAVLLGFLVLLGLVLIIVSAVRRKRARAQGQMPKSAGLTAGIILTLLPGVLIGVICVLLKTHSGESSWKRAVSARDTLEAGLTAGDADMIYSAFSETAKAENPALRAQLEDMLTALGSSIGSYSQLLPKEVCDKYNDDGSFAVQHFSGDIRDAESAGGAVYFIRYYGYSQFDGEPGQLGLTCIAVYDSGSQTVCQIGDEF